MVDSGTPIGSEAAFSRPAILAMDEDFLRFQPPSVFVVPITSTLRRFPSHIPIDADAHNGLSNDSVALVEQMRSVSILRCSEPIGNAGPVVTHQIRDVVAMIIGLP